MNAYVAFQTNATGARNITPEQRAKAAQDVNATYRTKAVAYLAKAGLIAKSDTSASTAGETDGTLNRDAFLQLLVLQMQNQDPLEPIDNTEMIAQLAQFSALEQMQQVNQNIQTMNGDIAQLNFMTAGALIGRQVSGNDASGQAREGVVRKIVFEDNRACLILENGYSIPIDNVTDIGQPSEIK